MDAERQRIIDKVAEIVGQIDAIFGDAQHWNDETRPRLYPNDEPINPDPDGKMATCRTALKSMLAREAGLGHFPTVEIAPTE